MTSPVVFPDWFEDPFVDLEDLMIDLFTKAIPGVESGCWTPDDWLSSTDPPPLLQFFRMPGGQVDWERAKDEAVVQASIITGSRDESKKVMSLVRGLLLPMQGFKFEMEDGYTAQIHSANEVSGPQMLTPNQMFDLRIVAANFKLSVGLKNRKRIDQIVAAL